jgi:glutamate synthase (NADPH/NADH) small chain
MSVSFVEKLECPRTELLFEESKPLFNKDQAVSEASRCLFCSDAPCMQACPTHINVPLFIRQIMTENLNGSAKTILSANIMGLSCAHACPVEVLCEGACVMNKEGKEAIHIGRLQRYAVENAYAKGINFFSKGNSTGKKAAIIGSGPAGLSCAAELARLGHEVVVYESRRIPGGLDSTAVAPYKLFSDAALKEIAFIQRIGIEIKTGITIGKDFALSELEKQYDLIFVGIGLGQDSLLKIPGEDLTGCMGVVEWIENIKRNNSFNPGSIQSAAVIGGGNTAIDAVRELKKLKVPKVTLIYRRTEREMSGYKHEKDRAAQEGVEFLFQTTPLEILGSGGRVTGIKLVKTKGEDGRLSVVSGSEFNFLCDFVLKAAGQEKLSGLFSQIKNLKIENGLIKVHPETFQTDNPKYYAAGDCVSGGEEVVNSVADGKKAAKAMHQSLLKGK